MKAIVVALALIASSGAAHALELQRQADVTACVPGLWRASTEQPAPCCNGQRRCAQFLSTSRIVPRGMDPRT